MSDILTLDGCRPTPLASYLKALGVLRLVAEQVDRAARGSWRGERFQLKTALDRDGLCRFFLEDYAPTPIIAPWNGGSGFYPRDAKDGITAIGASASIRFNRYRGAIALGTRLIAERRLTERPTDLAKSALIAGVRAEADETTVSWLDAAVALTLDRTAFPPLLGTGGNDGRLDFTNNFMQRLTELIDPNTGCARVKSRPVLENALFASPTVGLSSAAIGQFSPGAAGGVNSTSGYEGVARVNGWDYVLMLEGALIFAGGVSRRLEGSNQAYLSYPFTVRAAGAGFGTASLEEQADSRGELWVPLWDRPATLAEVRVLFREGRLSLGTRPARDGLDAARAVARLGADRRVRSFERYGFVKRQGLAYLAAPLGRRLVTPNPAGELVSDLDKGRWLDRLRSSVTGPETAAGFRNTVRGLEDSLFDLVGRPQEPLLVQAVLIAVGRLGRLIADRPKLQESLHPPPHLSRAWIAAADNSSREFRLAAALAGLRAKLSEQGSANKADVAEAPATGADQAATRYGLYMRQHLAPLDPSRPVDYPAWSAEKGGALAVWGSGGLIDNLCAVAQRRLLEGSRLPDKPFSASVAVSDGTAVPVAVDSDGIAAFLEASEGFDEGVANLMAGLAWVEPAPLGGKLQVAALPFAYVALKPMFATRAAFARLDRELPDMPIPPALPALLISGQVEDALRLGQERARASGLPTPFLSPRRNGAVRRPFDIRFGRRLLAALIIPVMDGVLHACLNQAYPSDEETDDAAKSEAA